MKKERGGGINPIELFMVNKLLMVNVWKKIVTLNVVTSIQECIKNNIVTVSSIDYSYVVLHYCIMLKQIEIFDRFKKN